MVANAGRDTIRPSRRSGGLPMPDGLARLEQLVATLRGPDGCPWDREQRLGDLRAYLLEEAYEVAAAIDADDLDGLGEELGDLLFQVVFAAALLAERGGPAIGELVERVHEKMVARHPHVFAGEAAADADAVRVSWEARKAATGKSRLAGIPAALPALVAAYRMGQKAAAAGFDWESPEEVALKVEEEWRELRHALDGASEKERRRATAEELGDLLQAIAQLARRLDIDPEAALAAANRKFRRRFTAVEQTVADDPRALHEIPAAELETLWERLKAELDRG